MKNIQIPENFDGNKFKEIYGEYPVCTTPGYIDVDDSINDLSNCVDNMQLINQRIKVAWDAANNWSESQFDTNSKLSALALMSDPNCPEDRMAKIKNVIAWQQVVWGYYKEVKDKILQGIDATYDTSMPGNCPWSIWQISE
jgi:hypothetical protein